MIIRGGLVVTTDPENRVMESGSVRITNDRITAVSESPIELESGELVIDADGMVVMPGLVNTHAHLFQTLLRGVFDHLPLDEYLKYIYRCGVRLTRSDCRAAATLGSLEAIVSGTTTVVDHHFLNRGSELAAGTIDGMLETGLRSVLARTVMDIGDELPAEVKEDAASGLRSVTELLESYHNRIEADELVIMTGPNTPGINASDAVCKETADFAREHHLRRSAHVAEYLGVRQRVLDVYGIDGVVRWLDGIGVLGPDLLAVHAVQVDEDEVDLLADQDVCVSHNPFSNLFCGSDIAPVDQMLTRGITVALGTDGAANNNGQGILDVIRITRLLQRSRPDPFAISPEVALRMATIDGARALGIDHLVGSIEVGKLADLVILQRDGPHMVPLLRPVPHLAAFAKGSDARTVIIGGRLVMRDREILTVDQGQVLQTAQSAGASLVARLG